MLNVLNNFLILCQTSFVVNFRAFFQKNHSRDKSLQGNTVRLKEVVLPCDDGMYVLDNYTGKVTEFSGLTEQRKQVKPIRFVSYKEAQKKISQNKTIYGPFDFYTLSKL